MSTMNARIGVVVLVLLASSQARAAGKPFRWDTKHARFQATEYVLTGTTGPFAMFQYTFLHPPAQPRWIGGILFDDAARNLFRLHSPDALRAAWTGADATGVTLAVLVAGVDSIIVPIARGSFEVAWETTMMNAESFALGSLVAFTLTDTVGRARPVYQDCTSGKTTVGCDGLTASFPSGHTTEAFIVAGLSCAHHLYGRLYGSRAADAFACARDLTLASFEGMLRVAGDRHWISDVIIGSAIGFAFGFGLPTLLHYRGRSRGFSVAPTPLVGANATGLALGGRF